jgi:AcrR family transcriptional regulator
MAKIKVAKNGTKKDVITSKAAILFKVRGFSATSMRELAEMVGVEASSLYNHIGSKSEILQEICFRVANLFTAHLNEVEQSDFSNIDKIEKVMRFHIRMMMENFESVYVSDHEWRHLPEPYLSNYQDQRRTYRKRLSNLIEKGITSGEIKNIDPFVSVLTILSAIAGIESWQRSRKTVPAETLEKNMVRLLIDGLKI